MTKKGADRRVLLAYPGVAETDQDRHHTEAHPHGSAYPRPRRTGSAAARLLPHRGLPDLPDPPRRLDRLQRPAHHQRRLASHRPGRQAAPRHRLCRLPLRRLGVGRPGPRPGHRDPGPADPRRRRLDRRRRHPLPQARRQGRLRRHLPRPGPLVEAAQDLPLRRQLRRAGHRRADPDADRPLLVPVGPLADLPQEGPARPSDPPPGRRGDGPHAGRGRPGPDPSGWSATAPTSTRPCCATARRTWR